ncbi:MAG: class I SAM-dependent methyltransferase [Gaiella sp.]
MKTGSPLTAAGLLSSTAWSMHPGERAALEGILCALQPALAIEIGTDAGGSLERISAHSEEVHAFDPRFDLSVTQERFPNVHLHRATSQERMPEVLADLAAAGRNVDFVLVDGDHSAPGVSRDLVDLLESPATARTVIVLHDTLYERVRRGLESVNLAGYPKVTYVDFDFVYGTVRREGQGTDDLWGGLGIIVTGIPIPHPPPRTYPAPDVYDAFAQLRAAAGQSRLGARQLMDLELDLAREKYLAQLMRDSWSWRLTAPLRGARTAVRGTLRPRQRARRTR